MNNKTYAKTIKCGKIDWNGTGRRVNAAELDLELKSKDRTWCFSCCGSVWNSRRTDLLAGGQCLDEMFKFEELAPWREVYDLWKRWHLNNMRGGSPAQEAAVNAWTARREKAGKAYDYDEALKMLRRKGLLFDKSFLYEGKPYKYGTAWLTEAIPDEALAKIRKWMEIR